MQLGTGHDITRGQGLFIDWERVQDRIEHSWGTEYDLLDEIRDLKCARLSVLAEEVLTRAFGWLFAEQDPGFTVPKIG